MPPSVEFNTAHNVNINVRLATLWQRIIASVIDNFIKGAIFVGVGFIFYEMDGGNIPILATVAGLLIIPVLLYSFLFEKFYNGQTPGKQAMNIKVSSIDGGPVSTGQYLIRWLFRLIDINMMSGLIAILGIAIGGKGQRIGDMVANTTVVDLTSPRLSAVDKFQDLNPDYQPKYLEAKHLSEKEVLLIKEVLSNRSNNRFELIVQLSDKVSSEFHIVKEDSSEEFLKRMLSDYQFYKTTYLDSGKDSNFV